MIQVMDEHKISIETHGDLGFLHFGNLHMI